jgi:hypothetical protein
MRKLDEQGSFFLPFIITAVLLVSALAFGFWAFSGRSDYKNNVDE